MAQSCFMGKGKIINVYKVNFYDLQDQRLNVFCLWTKRNEFGINGYDIIIECKSLNLIS